MDSESRLRLSPLALALSLCLVTGCATVFRGTTQKIEVFTEPHGAVATAGDQKITTPGVLRLPRNAKVTEVRIEKAGFETRTAILERDTEGLVWLNFVAIPVGVLSGAAIGSRSGSGWLGNIGEGAVIGGVTLPAAAFAVDYGTGAAYRLVPAKLVVKLLPSEETTAAER